MTYISNEYKFIFIEIPKTGTTSINHNLRTKNKIKSEAHLRWVGRPTSEEEYWREVKKRWKDGSGADRHNSAYHIKYWDKYHCYVNGSKMLDYDWYDYTRFSVVRNPWQRYASYVSWHFKNYDRLANRPTHKKFWDHSKEVLTQGNFDPTKTLYVILNNKQLKTQEDFLYDYDNQYPRKYNESLLISDILKFENLQEDYSKLCKKLNIKKDKLNRENVCPPYNYKDFYNNELVDMVYEKEKRIIDMMNYTYD